jgi:hypothetical protein
MKKSLKPYVAGSVLAAVLTFSGPAVAVTVTNGSFESGLTGWTLSRGNVDVHTSATAPLNAQDGSTFVELEAGTNGMIRQTVALTVGRYLLSFWYSPNEAGNALSSEIGYRLGGLANGRVNATSSGTTVGNWIQVAVEVQVKQARNYLLGFSAYGKEDANGGYVDNVSIAPIPVPAAGFALLGGLAGLAGLRRRKKA